MSDHFGEHLTIDGYGGDESLLGNEKLVLSCLSDLVEKLGMRTLAEPVVYKAEGNSGKDPGGWTGFVVIQESHISIHTFPKRGFISADVYTCKNGLDTELVINLFRDKFKLRDVEKNFLIRGLYYPKQNIN